MSERFWIAVFTVGAVQGVFLSAGLLAKRTGNRRVTRSLAALVAVFALMILGQLLEALAPSLSFLGYFGISVELAIGPLLLLSVRFLFAPEKRLSKREGWLFVPLAAGMASWMALFVGLESGRVELSREMFVTLKAAFVAFKAVFLYTLLVLAFRELGRGLRAPRLLTEGRRPVELGWLRGWLVGVGVVTGFIYLTFFLDLAGVELPVESDHIGSLILAGMIYLLSSMVLLRPWVVSVRPRVREEARHARQVARLVSLLKRDAPYLEPELTLRQLAKALGLTENQLSTVINEGLGTSFYALLGRYRLERFEELARSPEHRHRSVLDLAFEAGFNSKASFYRTFREAHGTTPTAFRKRS